MKRILITAVLVLLILTVSLPLYAEDSSGAITEASAAVTTAPATVSDTVTSAGIPTDTHGAEERSFADELLDKMIESLPEILSGLSVIMTAVLCLVARKALLPALSDGLTKVAAISKAGADKCAELSDAAQKRLDEIAKQCSDAKKAADETAALARDTAIATEKISESDMSARRERNVIREVMLSQAEIFESLVQCSSLPQWKKDMIEKRFTEQKERIASLTEKDSEEI